MKESFTIQAVQEIREEFHIEVNSKQFFAKCKYLQIGFIAIPESYFGRFYYNNEPVTVIIEKNHNRKNWKIEISHDDIRKFSIQEFIQRRVNNGKMQHTEISKEEFFEFYYKIINNMKFDNPKLIEEINRGRQ